MFYYYLKKFLAWTLALLVLLEIILTGGLYLEAFLNYEPLPFKVFLLLSALQLPDSIRFACSMAAFCVAFAALGQRHIILIRTTHGTAGTLLEPLVVVAVAAACFCVFLDNYATPVLKERLFAAERRILVNGLRSEIARTGSFRIGQAVFTASGVDGDTMLSPFCAVGDLLVRGERGEAGDNEVIISNADIADVRAGKTFHAGTFQILFPSQSSSLPGLSRWIQRPWRAHRRMCMAIAVIPLTLIGFCAGLASGRLGQMGSFLLWLVLTLGVYLSVEKGMLDTARDSIPLSMGWIVYLWAVLCSVTAWFCAKKLFRCHSALGLET